MNLYHICVSVDDESEYFSYVIAKDIGEAENKINNSVNIKEIKFIHLVASERYIDNSTSNFIM